CLDDFTRAGGTSYCSLQARHSLAVCKTQYIEISGVFPDARGRRRRYSEDMSTLRQRILGRPRDLRDPHVFHRVSLIAFFAWVGLGADGLSSSAYGPEEAFKHLGGGHYYLAVFLALTTALTVFIISYAYSRIIEHFPHGGGGY